jgi:hypothetical protein
MNLKSLSLMAISTCVIVLSAIHPANAGVADRRVKEALDSAGLQYEVTSDNTYKVTISIEGGRSQVVLIDSDTSKINGANLEFREVYSLGYKSKAPLSKEITNKLMAQSHDKKIGSWELIQEAGNVNKLVVFTAKIDAEMNGKNLDRIIKSVGLVADDMENELTNGKDEY